MSDDPSDSDALLQAALARRATLRIARLIVNALSIGLVTTMLLAIGVLWLEKRSGITLDREQYRGLLLIIFLVFTLSAYVVLEFFQHHDDREDARLAKIRKAQRAHKPQPETFAPIFIEPPPPSNTLPGTDTQVDAPPASDAAEALTPSVPGAAPSMASSPPRDDVSAITFTQAVAAAAAGMQEEPTPFINFGLHLYVMGGCGERVRRNALTPAQGRALFIRMLKELGLSQRSAASFAGNANTYAQVPHFRGPIDAGYHAMAHLNESGFVNLAEMTEMLEQWAVQDGICKAPELVTFMATSMGLQPQGAAPEDQQVVMRAHNKAVAAMVERFDGREVHYMGNGKIICFADPAQAVRAAEGCQEYLDLFALENPKLHVSPRIGIDTEMAAAVADTYISAAMTRAVTIAALTPPHHIYCSAATSEDSTEVVEFQPVEMPGAQTELPKLFAAVWSRMPARGGAALEYRQLGTMVDINPALSGSSWR